LRKIRENWIILQGISTWKQQPSQIASLIRLATVVLAALLYILRRKRHRSIQRKPLYLRMSSVLLNTSILAIYGLWKSSELYCWQIARSTFHSVFVMPNGAIANKDKNTTVRFSVRIKKLYLRISNVLLIINTSILAIYGLWKAKLYCWKITRSTFHSVFVMPNGAIRIKIPPFDSALVVRNCTNYGCQMYYLSLKAKRNCIVDKSLKIIKLIY
jgi:hypothetical protein